MLKYQLNPIKKAKNSQFLSLYQFSLTCIVLMLLLLTILILSDIVAIFPSSPQNNTRRRRERLCTMNSQQLGPRKATLLTTCKGRHCTLHTHTHTQHNFTNNHKYSCYTKTHQAMSRTSRVNLAPQHLQ